MKKTLLITGIIISGLFALLFVILIAVPFIMKYIDPAFKGSAGYYFARDLDEKTGRKLVWKDTELMGLACRRMYHNAEPETDYDRLTYYLFDSESGAKRAMKKLRSKDYFVKDTVMEGEDSIRGMVDGTIDAIVYRYYFRSGNLIISCDYSLPETMDPDADYDFKARKRDFDRLIRWIPEEFANPLKQMP